MDPEAVRRDALRSFEQHFGMPMIVLYDPYGRPVYVPSSQQKIGQKFTVKTPKRFRKEDQ